jgi:hypothetical protein
MAYDVRDTAVQLARSVRLARALAYLVDLSRRLAPLRADAAVRMLEGCIGMLMRLDPPRFSSIVAG